MKLDVIKMVFRTFPDDYLGELIDKYTNNSGLSDITYSTCSFSGINIAGRLRIKNQTDQINFPDSCHFSDVFGLP